VAERRICDIWAHRTTFRLPSSFQPPPKTVRRASSFYQNISEWRRCRPRSFGDYMGGADRHGRDAGTGVPVEGVLHVRSVPIDLRVHSEEEISVAPGAVAETGH